MYRYKRLLVSLNMDEGDKSLTRYAGMIAHMSKAAKVYFLHVAENLDIPDKIRKEYPDMLRPLDEFSVNGMDEAVKKFFNGSNQTEISYDVVEGAILPEILDMAVKKEIDLIIVGKKKRGITPGGFDKKLARKAPCSVLIVPEGVQPKIRKILTPVDFSENSADALDVAAAFVRGSGLPEIFSLNVYQVPIGYYKTGKSYDEFAKIMEKNARENMNEFIQNIELGDVAVQPILILDKKASRGIESVVKKEDIDLLVMGARGRSAAAAVLLGSVTEQLIMLCNVPLIAVKKKGANMNVIKALLAKG